MCNMIIVRTIIVERMGKEKLQDEQSFLQDGLSRDLDKCP